MPLNRLTESKYSLTSFSSEDHTFYTDLMFVVKFELCD